MISVKEAEELIFGEVNLCSPETLNIDALGQTIHGEEILRQDLVADRCYPPFHRVAMDGIAIDWQRWKRGQLKFPIAGMQRAGEKKQLLSDRQTCFEVMTGASLPSNCSVVIRYEDLVIDNSVATISEDVVLSEMENIHTKASDFNASQIMVKSFESLLAPQWSMAASLGYEKVKVSSRPRISVISTGDELVAVGSKPEEHQIRRSNAYALLASLAVNGFHRTTQHHFSDSKKTIFSGIESQLKTSDIVILSGGVSMGKFDFVPSCLADLGVRCVFHKVNQKPGKPLWFGKAPAGQLVFGLPGNPVSALVCLHRYVLPALWRSLGRDNCGGSFQSCGELQAKVTFKKKMTRFLPVKISSDASGKTLVQPISSNGSGDFSALLHAQGFIELAANVDLFPAGTSWPLYQWRS